MDSKNIDNELRVKPFTSYIELQRKKELKKIMSENKRMLDRIQNTIPSYRHVEWELDAEKRVQYLQNMTEFPDLFVPPRSSSKLKRASSVHSSSRKNEGTFNNEISTGSPFRTVASHSKTSDSQEEDMVPHPPEPFPMEQTPNSRKVDRPVCFPNIKDPRFRR
jgi:hypothetical protein